MAMMAITTRSSISVNAFRVVMVQLLSEYVGSRVNMMRETADVFPKSYNRIVECGGFVCKTLQAEWPRSWAKSPVFPPGGVFFSDFLPREAHGGPVSGADFDLIGRPIEIDRHGEGLAGRDKMHACDARPAAGSYGLQDGRETGGLAFPTDQGHRHAIGYGGADAVACRHNGTLVGGQRQVRGDFGVLKAHPHGFVGGALARVSDILAAGPDFGRIDRFRCDVADGPVGPVVVQPIEAMVRIRA